MFIVVGDVDVGVDHVVDDVGSYDTAGIDTRAAKARITFALRALPHGQYLYASYQDYITDRRIEFGAGYQGSQGTIVGTIGNMRRANNIPMP